MEKMRLSEVSAERTPVNMIRYSDGNSLIIDALNVAKEKNQTQVVELPFMGESTIEAKIEVKPEYEFDDVERIFENFCEKNQIDLFIDRKWGMNVLIINDLKKYSLKNVMNFTKALEIFENVDKIESVDEFQNMLNHCFYTDHEKKYNTKYIFSNFQEYALAETSYFEYFYAPKKKEKRIAFYLWNFCHFFGYEMFFEKIISPDFFVRYEEIKNSYQKHTYVDDDEFDTVFLKYEKEYIDIEKSEELYKFAQEIAYYNTGSWLTVGYVAEGKEVNFDNYGHVFGNKPEDPYNLGEISFSESNEALWNLKWSKKAKEYGLDEKIGLPLSEFLEKNGLEDIEYEFDLSEEQEKILEKFKDDIEEAEVADFLDAYSEFGEDLSSFCERCKYLTTEDREEFEE